VIIASKYKLRGHFHAFHIRRQRWAVLVAHRRAGKTVSVINDLIEKASYNTRENPRYAYIAPLLRQAKDIAWQYLKDFASPYNPKINESGLWVELSALPNSPRITLYGADNPDSFRGIYLDGCALDEFGNMKGSVWKEVLLPALIDRRGWAVFMGTPNGPNHFRDMYYQAKDDPDWYVAFLPHTATGVLRDDDIAAMKKIMDEEQFAQEMLCSFEASVRGAIYARQIEQMLEEGRVGDYPPDHTSPTDVVMDLGWRDDSTMGFVQRRPDGLLLCKSHHDNLRPISFYIKYIKEYWGDNKLRPGQIWLPHDARAKSLQTGKSIIENFRDAALKPKIVPSLDLLDGIAAARKTFPIWYLHEPATQDLVLALKSYHREYDEDRKVFSNEPVHDWSSHYADMFRYASIVMNPKGEEKDGLPRQKGLAITPAGAVNYGFALEDIWDLRGDRVANRRAYG
jgi:hypothetical protein